MAVGRTTPENGATCFRLIGQLLPTFDASVRGWPLGLHAPSVQLECRC